MGKAVYLNGLNGLRAIAAISVLFAHTTMDGISDFGIPHIQLPLAGYGVTLFFVISGFLITYLLLLEREKNGINIRNFYVRRILRIWPIYYLFIIICFVASTFFPVFNSVFTSGISWYVFMLPNIPFIFSTGILILVHYWSIGVEEQFYLFWPWFVKYSLKRLLIYTIILFFVLFFVKSGMWIIYGKNNLVYRILGVNRFHCMLIGAFGAILFYAKNVIYLQLLQNKYLQIISWLIFILVGIDLIQIPAPISSEFFGLISLVLVIGQVSNESKIINLELPLFNFLGKISYGIYVFHPIVIFLLSFLIKNININIYLKYGLVYSSVFSITIILAFFSYNFYEMPFLKLKTKFSSILSSNSKNA